MLSCFKCTHCNKWPHNMWPHLVLQVSPMFFFISYLGCIKVYYNILLCLMFNFSPKSYYLCIINNEIGLNSKSKPKKISILCTFKGWLRIYYGLDLLLSKLSKAQGKGKFRERYNCFYVFVMWMYCQRFTFCCFILFIVFVS